MRISILFFGHYRDIVPSGILQEVLPEETTVVELVVRLSDRDNRLTDLLSRTRVAINSEFAPADTLLHDADEVAFLPPMSGG